MVHHLAACTSEGREARTVGGESGATLGEDLTHVLLVCCCDYPATMFLLVCKMLASCTYSASAMCTTEVGGCYVTVALLRWSAVGHLLLPSLQARVVARIVPRHHDVLEVLVLY
jgi:hypothetical protein